MPTIREELATARATLIRANYPDLPTIDAAIDLTTMSAKTSNDLIAQFLATVLTTVRDFKTYGYTQTMSAAQKKALYDELDTIISDAVTNLQAIQTAVHAYYLSLP